MAVSSRASKLVAERQQAEQASADSSAGTSLVVRKMQIVRDNLMTGLTRTRASRVHYRNGEAHVTGSNDGAQVSLDRQFNHTSRKGMAKT